jgi:ribonucleoside-diphosphate reductase alpha chain
MSTQVHCGVTIDLSRDNLCSPMGLVTWKDRYATNGETSPQQSYARVADAFCAGDRGLAQRIYEYVSKQWMMYSTPVYANGGANNKAMPISCFLNYVEDSVVGIVDSYSENAFLSVYGGGVGTYWGAVRSSGTKSSRGASCSGLIPFMHVADSQALAFNQGSTRNASIATYLDISHPEVVEFINMRKPSGGDPSRKNLNLHHGVVISDAFMEKVVACMKSGKADSTWDLIDPHTKEVKETVDVRQLWELIIETRQAIGEPYIMFSDTANEKMNKWQKEKGLKIHQSNLCAEIQLATGRDYDGDLRTAVCCLSSFNLAKWDEYSTTPQVFHDMVRFLDNVLQYFIDNAPATMKNAVVSATKERSIGVGTMGFISYLQSKSVVFESIAAKNTNSKIYKNLQKHLTEGSKILAAERGEPKDIVGSGMRNACLTAIAPNASSSILCGNASPSIESHAANVYMQKTLSGSFTVKNNELVSLLEEKYGMNNDSVWRDIMVNAGSVQHLSFMDDHDKAVFKTAFELDQMVVVELAADRQKYIDQSQSLNLFFHPEDSIKYVSDVHASAWKKGVKTLYYARSKSIRQSENLTGKQLVDTKAKRKDTEFDTCVFCEG